MTDILAKSDPQVSLKKHIEHGLAVWENLKLCFPSAKSCANLQNFWKLLRLAIIVHDLGKAHSEFQKLLLGLDNSWYSQRHELFSLPFTDQLQIPAKQKKIILRTVAGHHKSYSFLSKFIEDNYELDPNEFNREFSKVDTQKVITIVNCFERDLIKDGIIPNSPLHIVTDYQQKIKQVLIGNQKTVVDFLDLLLLIGAFHHCDHLASAFITQVGELHNESFIFLDKMKKSLQEEGFELYHHQCIASNSLGNVILTAPTGSGKTETSMFWLRNQLKYTGQGRVFYVLPFTASINAMFERLRNNKEGLGEEKIGMLHGKLDAYLYENLFEEAGNLRKIKGQVSQVKETFRNLQTPVKILTPFQLLKHLFGLKGFEKGIFEWVGGHFIFDEIHAYDPEVTAQIVVLLEFLTKHLQAKIFVMTATMPTFLKKKIGKSIGSFEEIKAEPELYESFKRHQLFLKEGLLADSLELIKTDLENGRKVLVVCNTVDQARAIFNKLNKRFESSLIHGKFTAEDRTAVERKLQNKLPQLLVGTQAIEISLNINYDVIYTEPAPLDALIQRFGRVNRKRLKGLCSCIVFNERNEQDKYIYEQEIVEKTWKVLQEIEMNDEGIVQEIKLQKYLDQVYPSFDEKSQKKFDRIYNLLTKSVEKLMPLEFSKEREEDYYKQFDGVKVLPAFYEKKFKDRLEQLNFIGAEQLKVSIRKNWFARLLQTSDLELKNHVLFPKSDKKTKPIEVQYYKINKRYRPSSGLELYKDEDTSVIIENSGTIF